jgi:large conductance mechanosensitive channel
MLKEFKEFALKGNVIDMAIGIIIGVAFGAIVNSVVNDLLMPPIGVLLGNTDFSNMFVNLSGTPYASLSEAKAAGAAVISYGVFINTVINFIIIAFVLFLIVRQMNRFRRKPEAPVLNTKPCPYCDTAIPLKATRCPNCTSELK